MVCCKDAVDLSTENVLTTLSAIKGKLMFDVATVRVKKIQCKMTPMVRKNIVAASKRLNMYGKKMPIVACFDEYGYRLPDTISIGNSSGITLQIIDSPTSTSESETALYLELIATEERSNFHF